MIVKLASAIASFLRYPTQIDGQMCVCVPFFVCMCASDGITCHPKIKASFSKRIKVEKKM